MKYSQLCAEGASVVRTSRIITVCAICLSVSSAAQAQEQGAEAVRTQLVREAEEARRLGDHPRALERARRAAELRTTPSLRLFLAAEHAALGNWLDALDATRQCRRDAEIDPTLADRAPVLAQCVQREQAALEHVGQVVVRMPEGAADAEVNVGASRLPTAAWGVAWPVLPGAVTLEVATRDGRGFRRALTVAAGETQTVDVVFQERPGAEPPSAPLRPDQPLQTPLGAPQTSCESGAWLSLIAVSWRGAPSRDTATGYGVFRGLVRTRLELDTVFPLLDEPQLEERHMAPIRPIRRSQTLGGVLLGVGAALAFISVPFFVVARNASDPNPAVLATGIVSAGAGVGLAFIGGVVVLPGAADRERYSTRMQTFLPDEDDMPSVIRGVTNHNARLRNRCSSTMSAPGMWHETPLPAEAPLAR